MTETLEKTYLIEFKNGKRQKITVPADWKVTFGPATKGGNANRRDNGMQMPMALRFYEADTKQRAIFTDVQSFRDTSIKIEEEKISRQEKDGYMECDGIRKQTVFHAEVKEWVDPDAITERPMLPADSEMFDSPKAAQASLNGEEMEFTVDDGCAVYDSGN